MEGFQNYQEATVQINQGKIIHEALTKLISTGKSNNHVSETCFSWKKDRYQEIILDYFFLLVLQVYINIAFKLLFGLHVFFFLTYLATTFSFCIKFSVMALSIGDD